MQVSFVTEAPAAAIFYLAPQEEEVPNKSCLFCLCSSQMALQTVITKTQAVQQNLQKLGNVIY